MPDRTFQGRTGQSHGFDQQVAFFQSRHEFGTQIHADRNTDRKHDESNQGCRSADGAIARVTIGV